MCMCVRDHTDSGGGGGGTILHIRNDQSRTRWAVSIESPRGPGEPDAVRRDALGSHCQALPLSLAGSGAMPVGFGVGRRWGGAGSI